MGHKSGFISIIGKPNVGKSTLMNAITGASLSIVTPKAQTTRHRIKGILNTENLQLVFSDTPGILEPHYLLHQKMMDFVKASLDDADVVLLITDLTETYMDESFREKMKGISTPLIVIINKIDLSTENEVNKLLHGWKKHLSPHAVIPVSAKEKFNLQIILDSIVELIPESPPYFSKEHLSDATERFFVSEIIREKIFLNYQEEIPYSTEVSIEAFKDEGKLVRINAVISVERDSQKAIIIGRKGESIKKVGTEARKDIESFLGKKVFLETFVRVEKDWRKKENKLRNFGYSSGSQ
ncbi:MAG: GTPase Era [Bacteroidetes bacterium]|nr:MAG: GTPase Era [Bacteroidota bacterium]REK03522.1 MAG: GTPase Era [Bacteroidota bacterium]REK34825.1 MAG: GTPase Era [Bacteroidota bacterium]REK49376.1 MAG: GTPase Era [Bacteroidota bacterium]